LTPDKTSKGKRKKGGENDTTNLRIYVNKEIKVKEKKKKGFEVYPINPKGQEERGMERFIREEDQRGKEKRLRKGTGV